MKKTKLDIDKFLKAQLLGNMVACGAGMALVAIAMLNGQRGGPAKCAAANSVTVAQDSVPTRNVALDSVIRAPHIR